MWPHPPFPSPLAPGVVDQDLAHGPRRNGEEVPAIRRGDGSAAYQFEVCFVDQRSWHERMAGPLRPERVLGGEPELSVDERKKLVERGGIAVADAGEQLGNRAGRCHRQLVSGNQVCLRKYTSSS